MSKISFDSCCPSSSGDSPESTPQNVQNVFSESDFGTVVPGSHIDVVSDITFRLMAPIIQTLPLIIASGVTIQIITTSRILNTLTYNNAVDVQFQGANASIVLFDVVLDGGGTGTAFNLQGGVYSFKFPDLINYNSLGVINSAIDIYFPGLFISTIVAGLSIVNAVGGTITECLIDAETGNSYAIFEISGSSTGSLQLFDNILNNDSNTSLVNIDSATISATARLQVTRNKLKVPSNLFASGSVNESDPRVIAELNHGAKASHYMGGWFINNNLNLTTFALVGTFVDLNVVGSAAQPDTERFILSDSNTGEITYIGKEPFSGTVVAQVSILKVGSLETYSIAVNKNGTILTDRQIVPIEVKTTIESTAVVTPITLVENDTLKLAIRADTSLNQITIVSCNMVVR